MDEEPFRRDKIILSKVLRPQRILPGVFVEAIYTELRRTAWVFVRWWQLYQCIVDVDGVSSHGEERRIPC